MFEIQSSLFTGGKQLNEWEYKERTTVHADYIEYFNLKIKGTS